MRKLALSFLPILVCSCAHAPQPTELGYQKMLNSWVGQDSEKLIRAWGLPTQTLAFPSGNKGIEYRHNGGSYAQTFVPYPGTSAYTMGVSFNCETTFFINSSDRIDSFRFSGNSCRALDADEIAKQQAEKEAERQKRLAAQSSPGLLNVLGIVKQKPTTPVSQPSPSPQ